MQSNHSNAKKELYRLTFSALMVSLSVVLGYLARLYLTFFSGQFRITLENLPILLAGIFINPVYGGAVGLASDLISSLATAQNINPLITLGAVSVGAVSGVCTLFLRRNRTSLFSLFFSVLAAEAVGSILIKTLGIAVMYGNPFFLTLGLRILNYIPIAVIEIIAVRAVEKNKSIGRMLGSIR